MARDRRIEFVRNLNGAGKVYSSRGTSLLRPNGGKIPLLAMVEHIPVVPNVKGTDDFVTLANVLRAQGLALQAATDREGNVMLYTPLNRLCYQARGLNSVSCGVEHMHMSIHENWTKKQLRASAWLWHYAKVNYGIPYARGRLRNGGRGVAIVRKKGHVSHAQVSRAAGYNDRTDPGPKYDWEYVRHCARFWGRHRSFRIRRNGRLVGA